MIEKLIYVFVLIISLMLIIAIFGRRVKIKAVKVVMLIIGDAGLFISLLYFSDQGTGIVVILAIMYVVLNILALRKILGKANPREEEYNMWHDNADNWKWGIFYYNPADHRLLVPKRMESMGWTVNFANPMSIIAFVVLIIGISVIMMVLQGI